MVLSSSTRRPVLLVTILALALLGLAIGAESAPAVSLPALFSDGMVLQRDTDAAFWGWAKPGEIVEIRASWRDGVVSAPADERGWWRARVSTPEAGGPHSITIKGKTHAVTLRDVWSGEVWICSGQSNMEWPLKGTTDELSLARANHPKLRFFSAKNTFSVPRRLDVQGAWEACTPETAARSSAVGYHFARKLQAELGSIPIGLISADWGGTRIEAWMSPNALRRFEGYPAQLDRLAALVDPNQRVALTKQQGDGWWDTLDGKAPGGREWSSASFDDQRWAEMELPATLSGDDLSSFDGTVYFRRTVELPAPWAEENAVLELGPIDDYDDVWVNGVHVGSVHEAGRWNQPRSYEVPSQVLQPGKNTIAVRVLDTGGLCGINGRPDQMHLRPSSAKDGVSLAGKWRYAVGQSVDKLPPRTNQSSIGRNTASALYQGMIAPLAPYSMRGALWYQGESNLSNPVQYRELFPTLIEDWRGVWGQGAFPFYFVQIAPYSYRGDTGQAALLREAQLQTLCTPRTGMAVTLDIGDPADIHPRNKRDVGLRLARLALSDTYGRNDVVASGPIFRTTATEEGALRIHFDHAEGLELREAPRNPFVIAGKDKRFVRARARVDQNTLVLFHPRVPEPVAARYAWDASIGASLFNGADLPASPFRTDNWTAQLAPIDNEDDVAAYRAKDPEFRPLFNGVDLTGWRNVNCAPSTWQAKDGMIVCSGIPTGELRTDRMYENFVLELEWRHLQPLGNAGLFVWSDALTARGQPFTRSVEVQVMDGQESDWYTSDGDIFPIHGATMKPLNGRGASRAFPTERRTNPSPEWNHYRVTCLNGNLSLAVNGKVVTRGRECSPRKGYICLESEGTPIHFRNLRIKELPASSPPLRADQVASKAEGFVPLYNGVDFSGWKHEDAHRGHWRAQNWILDFDGGGPDLWTEKSYRDFQLICDWRWTGEAVDKERPVILPNGDYEVDEQGNQVAITVKEAGDSGIYLRGSSKSQVNIWCWPCGSGEVYGYRTDANLPPEIRAGVTPRERVDAPLGEWNRFVITLRGQRLTVVLNGKTVVENASLPGIPESGPIALQNHGNPIQFANILIKELEEF